MSLSGDRLKEAEDGARPKEKTKASSGLLQMVITLMTHPFFQLNITTFRVNKNIRVKHFGFWLHKVQQNIEE